MSTSEIIRESLQIEYLTRQLLIKTNIALPFPDPLPPGVIVIEHHDLGRAYRIESGQGKGMLVLADVAVKDDGKLWYHVSFSRGDRIPDYEDRALIKRLWFGDDKWAFELLPEASNHVNIHPYCLHLWHCLEGRPFPEFSKFGSI
ncbi:hypothetical protein NIES2135_54380 [Leptolyngbya boryana NIES-2135]|jgi:hypothetical protein|uniref:DUF7694 domain-containing protein n=1 Tax=Leptolyngbya boryana NIES-2135 TaxID=1973484 RepID=A0A1Z4JP65_LEPBY|nr:MULTISPECIES: hypothetical protein [Leptolyngbya]BAY58565.1 hypothetical protein NIES2135_54380 [Leptolyngbya boryana NIES-2135]MBD2370759.1 hypothetical protein [Leptolyngbya sp. FACHB-161]MBD2377088.1 hypothetical protein [Leptolyngbya sp. FACHB-238]MBD2401531.1 hypothetical protein [Leptolyngbya sp. FACHB-239]MBD2408083.1 hypothetical protein [Leptolyngbya sp. FACHB-402]